jgi:nucleotide-binding universal stress UspA family protein
MPADGILDQAEQQHVDLIAMRTHGRMALEALLHPSVTWRVFRQSQAPILAWRQQHEPGTAEADHALPRFMLDRTAPIVVPLDGSALAERALPTACTFAQCFGNPLLLVRAAEEPFLPGVGADYPQELTHAEARVLEAAEAYLRARQEVLQARGLTVEIVTALGMPSSYIEEVVKHRQAGMVVMAAHGRSGPGRLLLGGTARSLLGQAEVPVVLVRTELADAVTRFREAALPQAALSGQRS